MGHAGSGEKWMGWNKTGPSVSKVTSFNRDRGDFNRAAIHGYTDYAQANSTGSRGVYKFYFVEDGLYEIKARVSWKKVEHYFLLVENGQQTRLTFLEAVEWLKKVLDLPY